MSSAELIVYLRPNTRGARTSRFVRLPAEEFAATRRLLTGMFGVSVCVRKQREVWLYENARIHLDRVRGLGHVRGDRSGGHERDASGAARDGARFATPSGSNLPACWASRTRTC